MDVKQYYRKIREMEAALDEEFPLLVSVETGDGGKAGVVSEVTRAQAAALLVEGRAKPATEEQKQQYRARQAAESKAVEEANLARMVQVAILAEPEIRMHHGKKTSDHTGAES